MKFVLKSTCSSSSHRLGVITNVARLPDFEMETPHAFLYTKGGTVPHLTHEVLKMTQSQKLGLHVSIATISNIQERLKVYKGNIADYLGMTEYITIGSYLDSAVKRKEGYHEKDTVSLWSRYGRKKYTASNYIEFMEDLKPDMFIALADGDTHSNSSQKRNLKSFQNTSELFEKCVSLYNNSEKLKSSLLIGAVTGGYDIKLREECSKVVSQGPVFGVVIDGLHDCSEAAFNINFSEIKPFIEASLKHIPDDKLRMVHGSWNPSVMLDLIELGIDIFDTTYPFSITEQNGALIFPNDEDIIECSEVNGVVNGVHKSIPVVESGHSKISSVLKDIHKAEEPPLKKIKTTSSKFHIFLSDKRYFSDFSPILKSCSCLACKHHTKAYIHHLGNVEELLGPTLLMIHNIHHYLTFLATVRKTIKAGTFPEFKKNFQAWSMETPPVP